MKNTIVVAGATGNLGYRFCTELVKAGAHVKAIVSDSSEPLKFDALKKSTLSLLKLLYLAA